MKTQRFWLGGIVSLLMVVVLYGLGLAVPIGQHTGANPSWDTTNYNVYQFATLPNTSTWAFLLKPEAVGTILFCNDCAPGNPPSQGATLSMPIECRWTGAQWNCQADMFSYGVLADWQGYGDGTVSGTTLTETGSAPFKSSDCKSGVNCTGAQDKTLIVYAAKQGTDWSAGMSCPHGTLINPGANNTGNFPMWAVNRATGTAGGSRPSFSQTRGGLTNDGSCVWETLTDNIATPLATTITNYISPTQVTINDAATVALSGDANFIYGSKSTIALQNFVNDFGFTGNIQLPCGTIAVETIYIVGRNVHVHQDCGAAQLDGNVYGHLGAGVIALGPGPAFFAQATWGTWFDGMRIKGISSQPALAAIEFYDPAVIPTPTPTPGPNNGPNAVTLPNEVNRVDNMVFANSGEYSHEADTFGQFRYDVAFQPNAGTGGANNGPFVMMNNLWGGATEYDLDLPDPQFLGNVFITNQFSVATLIEKGAIRIGAGQSIFQGLTVLTGGIATSTIGDGVFDLLNGAHVTVTGLAAEQMARFINCDMNGGAGMSSSVYVKNGYFQLKGTGSLTGTASDHRVINCGSNAYPTAALVNLTLSMENFLWTNNNSNPLATTPGSWTADVSNTTAGGSAFTTWMRFKDVGGQAIPFTLANITASTLGTNNRAMVEIRDQTGTDINASTNGTATLVAQNELNYPVVGHALHAASLPAPSLSSSCVVGVAGAKTCHYQVTVSDANGESTPSAPVSCVLSAALGSQDNRIQVFYNPGAVTYKLYGDDCNGGALNNLLATTATSSMVAGTTGRSFTFEDAAIARTGSAFPPAVNRTGQSIVDAYPSQFGGIQGMGFTPGEATFASLPSYNHTLIADDVTVLFNMDQASGNDTDVINGRVATKNGTIAEGQTGAIVDYSGTAVKPNGSTGYYSVADGAGLCGIGTSCSCELWVKFNSLAGGNQVLLGQKASGWVLYKAAAVSGNYLVLAKQGAGNIADSSSKFTFGDTTNYHQVDFTVTMSAGSTTDARIYVDANDSTVNYSAQVLAPADRTLFIGADATPANFFNGTLDQVSCVTGVVWTQAQIAAHYREAETQKFGARMYATDTKCVSVYTDLGWHAIDCGVWTVSGLPSCTASSRGGKAWVTDANATCTSTGFGVAPTGGGSAVCPVFCDGSAWLEG